MAMLNQMGMLAQPTNTQSIVGQIGPDGKPITFLDAMRGVRPQMNQNPFGVPGASFDPSSSPMPGINFNALTQQLGAKPEVVQAPGIMNTMRNFFGMSPTTTDVVDGQNVTYVDRVNMAKPTDQEVENEMAESGISNPMQLLSAVAQSGLLDTQQPQMMPMVQPQVTPGLRLQPINLAQYYGGILG